MTVLSLVCNILLIFWLHHLTKPQFDVNFLRLPFKNTIYYKKDLEDGQNPQHGKWHIYCDLWSILFIAFFYIFHRVISHPLNTIFYGHIYWHCVISCFVLTQFLFFFFGTVHYVSSMAWGGTAATQRSGFRHPSEFFLKCGCAVEILQCIMSAAMSRTIFIHTCTRFPTVLYMCFTFSLRLDFRGKFSSLFSLLLKLHAPPITGAMQSPPWCPWTALWVPENVAGH